MGDIEEQWARDAAANEAKEKAQRALFLKVAAAVIAVLVASKFLASGMSGCGDTKEHRCVKRGIAYFKEIGSYPRLSSGEDAEQEAKERCARTPTAFPK